MITSSISNWDIWGSLTSPLNAVAKSAKRVALKLTKLSVALSTIQGLGAVHAKGLSKEMARTLLEPPQEAGFFETVSDRFSDFFNGKNHIRINTFLDMPEEFKKAQKTALGILQSEIADVLPNSYEEYTRLGISDCFSKVCPDIDQAKAHPREIDATSVIYKSHHWFKSIFVPPEWIEVQEFLRFREDDPRDRFLYISAEHDHNGAQQPFIIAEILSYLALKYDLKFMVANSAGAVCEAIENAGEIAHLFIHGHGNASSIIFDEVEVTERGRKKWYIDSMTESTDFAKCFSNLKPNGKIILQSCLTGGVKEESADPFDNIAQKMADNAKRTVVAPIHNSYPIAIRFLYDDDPTLFHPKTFPENPNDPQNLFTSFRPNFQKCTPKVHEDNLTEREKKVRSAIKTAHIEMSFLHKGVRDQFENQFLQVCEDDPRSAILYLSAKYDSNGALNSTHNIEFISVLADRSDFLFNEIESFRKSCDLVNHIVDRKKKISAIIFDAHGTPEKGMILSKDQNGKEEIIDDSSDFSICLEKIKKDDTTLIFKGASLGQNKELVQKIANAANQTVLATTCPINGNQIKVQSTEPLDLHRSGYSFFRNLFIERCRENSDNHFATFIPNNPKIHEEL